MYADIETFVSKQLGLLSHERDAEISQNRALQESVSFKQLEAKGVCLLNLVITEIATGLYGRTIVSFGSKNRNDLPSHSFSPGDIVGIFPSSSSTNNANDQVCSGIVSRSGTRAVDVALDHGADELDDDGTFRVVKLANNVTYRRLKAGLESLKNFTGPGLTLINILFGEGNVSGPLTSIPPALVSRTGQLVFHNENLDESQKNAVEFAIKQKEIAVVHGPPGTGKTTTVVEIILQMVKAGLKVLACAPSNIAVDNLVERLSKTPRVRSLRLGHPSRMTSSIQERSLDAIVASSDSARIVQEVRRELDSQLARLRQKKRGHDSGRGHVGSEIKSLRKELRERESKTVKEILNRADVVLATLTSATDEGPLKYLAEEHFDYVVIDECSQATEAACWLALTRAPRVLLAGDHLQLPPTILSTEAAQGGLAVSLMERVEKKFGERCVRMLTTQYRMHERIGEWSSMRLYYGKLKAHASVAGHLLEHLDGVEASEETGTALLLIDTSGADLTETAASDEGSKANPGEAALVTVHTERLIRAGLNPADIAIITPYNLQVDLLRQMLGSKYPSLEIKSVDGFQGREKEAVILSLVRSNEGRQVGFLADVRRLNVAVTRARRHLCVVTDTSTTSTACAGLLEHMEAHGEVRSSFEYSTDMSSVVVPELDLPMAKPSRKEKPLVSTKTTSEKTEKVPKPKKTEAEVMEQFQKKLENFAKSQKKSLEFPSSLNSFERRVIHDIADKLGLVHKSTGENNSRRITVLKPAAEEPAPTPVPVSDPVQVPVSIPEPDETIEDISTQTVDELEFPGEEPPSTTASGTSERDPGIHLESTKAEDAAIQRVGTPHPVRNPSSVEVPADLKTCPKCQKQVPTSNFSLHELRCVKPVPQGARPKQKKLVKDFSALEKVDDDDAVLEMFCKMNNTCNFSRCKENISCLGQLCRFCNRRFCLSHHIPEVHGCSDQARAAARQMIIKQGVITPGSGYNKPKVDPTKRAHLQRRLEKKVTEMTEKRAGNPQKKK